MSILEGFTYIAPLEMEILSLRGQNVHIVPLLSKVALNQWPQVLYHVATIPNMSIQESLGSSCVLMTVFNNNQLLLYTIS